MESNREVHHLVAILQSQRNRAMDVGADVSARLETTLERLAETTKELEATRERLAETAKELALLRGEETGDDNWTSSEKPHRVRRSGNITSVNQTGGIIADEVHVQERVVTEQNGRGEL